LRVNVTVEELAPCKKLVRIEIDPPEVDKAFEDMTKEIQRQVAMPGFRKGKAPRDMVLKQYDKTIEQEVKKKLIPDAYRRVINDKKIEVVGRPDIEEIQFGRGQALQFAATIETAPAFELPEYKGLPVKRQAASVTEEDIVKAIDLLRERVATFNQVDRAAQEGDFAVVNFTGTSDGKPITEIAPDAPGLSEQKNFWVQIKPDSFIPGFAMQLVGAKAGEKRTVSVDFPADFITQELADKQGTYEVELVEVKEKVMPELDDAFAKAYGAESVERLREGVRTDLQNELNHKQNRAIRNQLIESVLARVNFDLPDSVVQHETRNVVFNIVNENQKRGVSREVIEKQKDQIYGVASRAARDRVKSGYIFQKIAQQEGIRVNQAEAAARVQLRASSYDMTPQQFVKELEKRGGVGEIYDELLNEKVLELLQQYARFEDVPADPVSEIPPQADAGTDPAPSQPPA
jgi:trigger factor